MSIYSKKIWKDYEAQFPNRRQLRHVSDNVYDVELAVGEITEEGNKFEASEFNDLENRISSAFNSIENSINQIEYPLKKAWIDYTTYIIYPHLDEGYFVGKNTPTVREINNILIEKNAEILAKYSVAVGNQNFSEITELDLDVDEINNDPAYFQYKIVERARELNPELKMFWYVGIASWRPGDPTTPILTAHEILQLVNDGLHVGGVRLGTPDSHGIYPMIGGMKFDGIFWDEMDMDTNETVVTQGAADAYSQTPYWTTIEGKDKYLIEYARNLNLHSFNNAFSRYMGLKYLKKDDFFLLESNNTRYDLDGYAHWMPLSRNKMLFDYYSTLFGKELNYYNEPMAAEAVPQDHTGKFNTVDELESLLTWCCYNTLVAGGKYVAIFVDNLKYRHSWNFPVLMKLFFNENRDEYYLTCTEDSNNNVTHYEMSVNGHLLSTDRGDLTGGSDSHGTDLACKYNTIKYTKIGIDGHYFYNDIEYIGEATKLLQSQIDDLQKNIKTLQDNKSKERASIYHRAMIDDWSKILTWDNLIVKSNWDKFIDETLPTYWTINSTTYDENYYYINATTKSTMEERFDARLKVYIDSSLAGHTIEVGVSGTWDEPYHNTVAIDGITTWSGFSQLDTETSQYRPNFTGSIITVTLPDEIDFNTYLNFCLSFARPNDTCNIKFYIIDQDQNDGEEKKEWYTNLLPSILNYRDNRSLPLEISGYRITNINDETKSFTFTSTQANYQDDGGILIDGPDHYSNPNFFKPGHTYELGFENFTLNTDAYKFMLQIWIANSNGQETYQFTNMTPTMSTIYHDSKVCIPIVIPEDYTYSGCTIGLNRSGGDWDVGDGVTPVQLSVENMYIYDLTEQITVRGKDPANAYIRIARTDEGQFETDIENDNLISDCLYVVSLDTTQEEQAELESHGYAGVCNLYITDFNKNLFIINTQMPTNEEVPM